MVHNVFQGHWDVSEHVFDMIFMFHHVFDSVWREKWGRIVKTAHFADFWPFGACKGQWSFKPGGSLQFEVPKFLKKLPFNKTCTTLTTILPREKMQLSKVVSILKRFGCPMEAPCRNRNFAPKFCLSEPYIQTVGAPWDYCVNIGLRKAKFWCKIAIFARSFHRTPKPF